MYYFIFMGKDKNRKLRTSIFKIYNFSSKLNTFIENIPKSKKNRRCNIHSLDKTKSLR